MLEYGDLILKKKSKHNYKDHLLKRKKRKPERIPKNKRDIL